MKPTVHRFSYPWQARVASTLLGPLSRTRAVGEVSPSAIADAAFRALGEEVPPSPEREKLLGEEFDHAMERLADGHFPPLGKVHWRAVLVSAARSRILLERYLAAGRPLTELVDPIFVVGLPRTGTSLVQRLIAEDPDRRGLRTFELISPVPSGKSGWWQDQKRMALGRLTSIIYRTFTPELIKIHYTSAKSLEECWMLFMSSYSVLNADYLFDTPHFGDWLLEGDMVPSYQRYVDQLRILAGSAPDKKLVLKSPEHLWFLEELLAVYPNARIIWTHRDPVRAVPSYTAQVSLLVRQHRGQVDPQRLAQRVMHRFVQGVDRGMRFCDGHPQAKVAHVAYPDLVADPVGTVRTALSTLGLPESDEHERAMRSFMARPAKDKNQNRYDASVFGLNESEIRERFACYISRFGLGPDRLA